MTITADDLKLTNISSVKIGESAGKTVASMTANWKGKTITISVIYDAVVKKTQDEFLKDIQAQQTNLLVLATKYKLGEKTQKISIDDKQFSREFAPEYIAKRAQVNKPSSAEDYILNRTDQVVDYHLDRLKKILESAGLAAKNPSASISLAPKTSGVQATVQPQTLPADKFEKKIGNIKIVLKKGEITAEELYIDHDENYDSGGGVLFDDSILSPRWVLQSKSEQFEAYSSTSPTAASKKSDTLKTMYLDFLAKAGAIGKIVSFPPLNFSDRPIDQKLAAKTAWEALKEFEPKNPSILTEIRFVFKDAAAIGAYNDEFKD